MRSALSLLVACLLITPACLESNPQPSPEDKADAAWRQPDPDIQAEPGGLDAMADTAACDLIGGGDTGLPDDGAETTDAAGEITDTLAEIADTTPETVDVQPDQVFDLFPTDTATADTTDVSQSGCETNDDCGEFLTLEMSCDPTLQLCYAPLGCEPGVAACNTGSACVPMNPPYDEQLHGVCDCTDGIDYADLQQCIIDEDCPQAECFPGQVCVKMMELIPLILPGTPATDAENVCVDWEAVQELAER